MRFSDLRHSPSHSSSTELRDYPEWHKGRSYYGAWIIPIRQTEVLQYINQARAALTDLLHPAGSRQPHLTLFVCGFECLAKRYDDDFPEHKLRQQRQALEALRPMPAELIIGQPDSFASAAFLPAEDPTDSLITWRSALTDIVPEVRQSRYIPHITLGLYRQRLPAEQLRQRLLAIARPATPLTLQVDELIYARYEARDQHGALDYRYRLVLTEK